MSKDKIIQLFQDNANDSADDLLNALEQFKNGEVNVQEIMPMVGKVMLEMLDDAETNPSVQMASMGAGMLFMQAVQQAALMAPELEAMRGTTVKDFVEMTAGDNLSKLTNASPTKPNTIDMDEIKQSMSIYRLMAQLSPEKYNAFYDGYIAFMPERLGAFISQFYTDDQHRVAATTATLDFYKNSTDEELRNFVIDSKLAAKENAKSFTENLGTNAYLNRIGSMDVANFSTLLLDLQSYISARDIDNAAGSLLPAAKSVAQAFADSNFDGLMQTQDVQEFLTSVSSVLQGVETLLSDAGVLPKSEEIKPLGSQIIKQIEKVSAMPVNPVAKKKYTL